MMQYLKQKNTNKEKFLKNDILVLIYFERFMYLKNQWAELLSFSK